MARSGDLDAFTESVRTLNPELQAEFAAIIEVAEASREMNAALGDLQRTLVANLAPVLTKIATFTSVWTTRISTFTKENQTLTKVIAIGLVGAIVALTIAGVALVVLAILPAVAAGFAMAVAWAPVILIILAVVAAVGLLLYALVKLGAINIDTSAFTDKIEDIRASVDLDTVRNARQQAAGDEPRGDTIINQTNNIEALGSAEEIAQTVGDETSNALHNNIYYLR